MSSRITTAAAATAVAVLTAGAGVLAGPASASSASPYTVTLHTSAKHIQYGRAIVLKGKVTGGPVSDRKVTLFWTRAAENDSWHKIGKTALNTHGHFRARYKPGFGGDIAFQVRKSRAEGHAAARTKSRVTQVYQWQNLTKAFAAGEVTDGQDGATARLGKATVRGTVYRHSLVMNDGATVTIHSLGCKAIMAGAGVEQGTEAPNGGFELDQPAGFVVYVAYPGERAPVALSARLDPTSDGLAIHAGIDQQTSGGTTNEVALTSPLMNCDAPAN